MMPGNCSTPEKTIGPGHQRRRRAGLRILTERTQHTERLVEGIGALEGAEVLAAPVINQGLVRFTAADGDHDRRTDEVIERLQKSGVTWFGGSDWKGRRVMRVPVLSWRTTETDIDITIEAVRKAMES